MKVGEGESAARWRLPDSASVRAWLAGFVARSGATRVSGLDLALIGNSSVAALLDAQGAHRLVLPAALRQRSGVLRAAAARQRPGGRAPGCSTWTSADFERSEQAYIAHTPILRTRLYDRHGGGVEITDFAPRFQQFGRLFCPVMLMRQIRPLCGQPAHPGAHPAAVRVRRAAPGDHLGQQPRALRDARHGPAADDRFLDHRDPRGDARGAARAGVAGARPRRDAARLAGRGVPAGSSTTRRAGGATGCAASPSPSSGRSRSSAPRSRSSSTPTRTPARSSPR